MRLLMLCLLTCVAYLETFNIDTMWTRVLCCDVCIAINWLILVLMQWISFVVVVPVSQLRASPRKDSRLLLHCVLVCSWLEFSSCIAEVIVVSLDLYMSCMLDNFSWSVVSSSGGADGCWSKDLRNCCILVSCLVKSFQWHAKFPSDTCAVMIQECLVGCACKIVWKITNSPGSVWDEFVVGVNVCARL